MNNARQLSSIGIAREFPKIDRYFPQCKIAAVEACSAYLFGVREFGKLYGRHTFVFEHPEEAGFDFKENGVELNTYFHRVSVFPPELEAEVKDLYGIQTTEYRLDEPEYREFCRVRLSEGIPFITNFDVKYLHQRREYRKVSVPHVLVLTGFDAQRGQWHAAEQMLGQIVVPAEDFEDYIRLPRQDVEELYVWDVTRPVKAERALERKEVLERIEDNLENLRSPEPTKGLNALRRFRDQMSRFLASPEFPQRPFSVPGLWVFSHERHTERKWLREVALLCSGGQELFQAFDATLEKLFELWIHTDYLLEKCLESGRVRALAGLPNYLDEIMQHEERAVEHWQRLRDAVMRG